MPRQTERKYCCGRLTRQYLRYGYDACMRCGTKHLISTGEALPNPHREANLLAWAERRASAKEQSRHKGDENESPPSAT